MAASTTIGRRTSVWGLGEIALRVNNLDAMQKFYEEVIGLALMTRVPNCAFFKIADGYGGHTQVLALFDRSRSPGYRGTDATTSTIDHIVKNQEYRDTPSIQRYVMLEQDRQAATVFARQGDDWAGHVVDGDVVLAMPEIGVELPLAELYDGVAFTESPETS